MRRCPTESCRALTTRAASATPPRTADLRPPAHAPGTAAAPRSSPRSCASRRRRSTPRPRGDDLQAGAVGIDLQPEHAGLDRVRIASGSPRALPGGVRSSWWTISSVTRQAARNALISPENKVGIVTTCTPSVAPGTPPAGACWPAGGRRPVRRRDFAAASMSASASPRRVCRSLLAGDGFRWPGSSWHPRRGGGRSCALGSIPRIWSAC